MQEIGVVPSNIIEYTIGLFCMENFSFGASEREKFEAKMNINLDDIVKLNMKENVIVTLKDGKTTKIPFEELDDIARPSCLLCSDFSNDFADISVGGLGSPDGYTTTLIRTDRGRAVYQGGLKEGYIEEKKPDEFDGSVTERTKMIAKIVSFANRKKERALSRLEKLGVS
ncbi:MAG: Coenzyme F420 hydrogenase/dehydrogenase, beta subunit C-terminal domain [bacterium]